MSAQRIAPATGPGLSGLRILVPRDGATGERIAAAVRERGGDPVILPLTVTAPPRDPGALADAARRWNSGAYDWLAVTSANGARAFAEAGARPGPAPVAAVGPATADALRRHGFAVAVTPEHDFSARGLAVALAAAIDRPRARVLLPLSEIAGDELETALARAGHEPERVTAYRTLPAAPDPGLDAEVAEGGLDAILVMSGSGAAELARRYGPIPGRTRLVAIGGPTAAALAARGLRAHAVASRHTVDGMLDALASLARPSNRAADPLGRPLEPHHPEGNPA